MPSNADEATKHKALIEAVKILELDKKLDPASPEARIVLNLIEGWIEEHGPKAALDQIRLSKEELKGQIDTLAGPAGHA